jgi:hypothetical protein
MLYSQQDILFSHGQNFNYLKNLKVQNLMDLLSEQSLRYRKL